MRRALVVLAACGSSPKPVSWQVTNAESQTTVEDGKRIVTLVPVGGNRPGSNIGMALVPNLTFTEGTIDVDLRGPGERDQSFIGIAFGIADANHYEAVYFRPFRFRAADPVDRSHAVQYIAWPEHTWEALRARAPGTYEAAIAPVPDPAGWFHVHLEVTSSTVKVFVDGAPAPALVVERLRRAGGSVGLWVDSKRGSFANLQVR